MYIYIFDKLADLLLVSLTSICKNMNVVRRRFKTHH